MEPGSGWRTTSTNSSDTAGAPGDNHHARRVTAEDLAVRYVRGLRPRYQQPIKRLREALGDTADTPHYIETLPRRGYRFIANLKVVASRCIQSLAVLPLENLSGDPEQEYFADGMTEALITNLAKISALQVISRTPAASR